MTSDPLLGVVCSLLSTDNGTKGRCSEAALGGWGSISEESRSSLEQVGVTLCGYPQLASEARYAAGQIGHVARRLLLGENVAPFLGQLDLAETIRSD